MPPYTPFRCKLEQQLRENSFPGTALPELTCGNEGTELVDIMTALISKDDVILIITNPAYQKDISSYMLSAHCMQIMDWATVPVMIVPETTLIRNPEKIAIIANLGEQDTDYINVLGNLVEQFSSEIMVSHLTGNHSLDGTFTPSENKLLANIYKKVDYGRVYYRRIIIGGQEKGWRWLNNNKKCDLIAVSHQPQNALKEFFNLGCTPEITHHLTIPVIVLPYMG